VVTDKRVDAVEAGRSRELCGDGAAHGATGGHDGVADQPRRDLHTPVGSGIVVHRSQVRLRSVTF